MSQKTMIKTLNFKIKKINKLEIEWEINKRILFIWGKKI